MNLKTQVGVSVEVLETETIYAEAIGDLFRLMRCAAESDNVSFEASIGRVCWLGEMLMSQHEDVLRSAARGKMTGCGFKEFA